MQKLWLLVVFITLTFSLLGCEDQKTEPPVVHPTANSNALTTIETDKWLGRWNGPEGTFLKLSGGEGKYEITIQNLDGPQVYSGISLDNKIRFERNGVIENIHATSGLETGMKWLSEKHNCLTIKRGEGFCRD
ncbi:hypothetical protein GCM10011613_16390 [Cellvibrio zantedeschiae]|uniref:Lipoprotein n=1 Tax=Cellvibrio zantedeschiae TaxID=1237077 RepID=A0ABQ3B008_9GAMM|nr:hypothetical protein [Cellvibrio zantedeschiae]GGY72155.1 hypothetical protein GCM10011613_16390 [Cellvibrio zantedeschiae]